MIDDNATAKHKVLLTGAAGRIGSAFREHIGTRYHLRLADRNLANLGDPADHEVIRLDVADPDACQAACVGIETVVHLAGDPSGRSGFYNSLLDNNVKGVYNIFQAAADQGCRRVVFASTVQTISGYPLDVQVRPEMPVRPLNMYAASKIFGEAVAHVFAMTTDLSAIAVRIGSFAGNRVHTDPPARTLSTFISQRDMSELLVRCIEAPQVKFAIVHGVSDNRFKRLDLTTTRELLDYHPQDDSFQIFDTGLKYWDRWYDEAPNRKPPATEGEE